MIKGGTSEGEIELRKQALVRGLKDLAKDGRYEITPREAAGRSGFTLHKMAGTKSG